MSAKSSRNWLQLIGIAPIRLYQLTLSGFVGFHCRYQPTCSAYAIEAIERHGLIKGLFLAARRLGRCHPWGGSGYDPVPQTHIHSDRFHSDRFHSDTCSHQAAPSHH